MAYSKGKSIVGLDIEPGYVAAVQANANGSILVERAAGVALDLDIVREGEVLDSEALSEVLRNLFHESHLDRRVRVGVANQRTVLRTLELPPIADRKELAAAVHFQAEDQVPMPLSNAVLDFQPLDVIDTPAGPRQRVVLVAAQRDMVDRLLAAVRGAGLRPEGVDLSAFAMIRSLYSAQAAGTGRTLYLNVAGLTNMAVAEGSVCLFTRVVGDGLEAMASDVAERRGVTLVEARELLCTVGLAPPPPGAHFERAHDAPAAPAYDAPSASGLDDAGVGPGEPAPEAPEAPGFDHAYAEPAGPAYGESSDTAHDEDQDVRLVLEHGVREIAAEVRHSLDFYDSQDGGGAVAAAVISGSALEIEGFAAALEAELGLPVRAGTVGAAREGAFGDVSPQRLAVAAGLAVEGASA
jgi:type IV pilus assembly protein PilM